MYNLNNVGNVVKELRKRTGKTQETVAYEMGMDSRTYANIERGKRAGSIDSLLVVAEYYKVSVDYLCGREVPSHPIMDEIKNMSDEQQNHILVMLREIKAMMK